MNPGIPVVLAGGSGRSPGNSSSHNKIKWGTHKPALAKPPQRSKISKPMLFSRTPITICNFLGSAAQTMGTGSLWKPKSDLSMLEVLANLCWASLTLVGGHVGEQRPRKWPANASPWRPDMTSWGTLHPWHLGKEGLAPVSCTLS